MCLQLKISGMHFNLLKKHLLPSDNKEAVAVALCGTALVMGVMYLWKHKAMLIKAKEEHRYNVDKIKTDKEIKKIKSATGK